MINYGVIPDAPGTALARPPVEQLVAARGLPAGGMPSSVDRRDLVDRVRSQWPGASCVGQGMARSIHMRAAATGRPIPFPSAQAIYSLARKRDTVAMYLPDVGCRAFDAACALREVGIVDESRWPDRAETLTTPVPWDVLQHGTDARVEAYRCDNAASVKLALARDVFPCFAMPVDEAFERYDDGGVNYEPGGGMTGRHMMTCVGYRGGSLLVVNSWSSQWGDGGFVWIPESTFDALAFDVYAFDVVPASIT